MSERSGRKIKWGEEEKQQSEKQACNWKILRRNVLCVTTPEEMLLAWEHSGKTVNKVQQVSQQSNMDTNVQLQA